MSFDDWILSIQVLSAFAYVAGVILFWVLIVAVRRTDAPDGTVRMEPIVKVGNAAVGVGAAAPALEVVKVGTGGEQHDAEEPTGHHG